MDEKEQELEYLAHQAAYNQERVEYRREQIDFKMQETKVWSCCPIGVTCSVHS